MSRSMSQPSRHAQQGGITILVVLMLLVLLTIASLGMSRNAFREIVISGTSRQGAMARNVADSGIEWSIYWMDSVNRLNGADSAVLLRNLKDTLNADETGQTAGRPWALDGSAYPVGNPPTVPDDQKIGALAGTVQGFTVALTRMGKLPVSDISQGSGPGSFAPAQGNEAKQAPDLWAVRSDSQVRVGTGLTATTFYHSKEAWISTPAGM